MQHDQWTVAVGSEEVTLSSPGKSSNRTGKIFGRECDDEGKETIYLDRLLLPPGRHNLAGGWQAWGAVSTVLVRKG